MYGTFHRMFGQIKNFYIEYLCKQYNYLPAGHSFESPNNSEIGYLVLI